jgi:hypothetical protein
VKTPLLLGFDRERWERRKAELRARLVRELSGSAVTVRSREQVEAENISYWTSRGMSHLRQKFANEAEAARVEWVRRDPDGPNGRDPKYKEIREAELKRRREEKKPNSPIEASRPVTVSKCDTPEGKDSGPPSGPPNCDIVNDLNKRVCKVCGQSFLATRDDALLCSARCRKRASRDRTLTFPQ